MYVLSACRKKAKPINSFGNVAEKYSNKYRAKKNKLSELKNKNKTPNSE